MSRTLLATTAALLGLVGTGLAGPALADGDLPPVTAPDSVTILPSSARLFDVISNDTDDVAGDLSLCRVGAAPDLDAEAWQGRAGIITWDLDTMSATAVGDYDVAYQACDHDYLSVGHVTVHVVAPQAPTVSTTEQPGVLSVHNPNAVPVRLAWGAVGAPKPDGHLRLKPSADATFTVARTDVAWVASDPYAFPPTAPLGQGEVHGITLPARTATPSPTSRWRATAPAWAARERHAESGPGTRSRVRVLRAGTPASAPADWPADPTTVEPPVTQPDTLRMWAGGYASVDVATNDTDPAGQPLDPCRIDDLPAGSHAWLGDDGGKLDVATGRHFAGSRSLPYYMCNNGRLSPSSLTVVTEVAQHAVAWRGHEHPWNFHVHNPNPQRISMWVGQLRGSWAILMYVGQVPGHGHATFSVPRHRFYWEASIGHEEGFAGAGHAKDARR